MAGATLIMAATGAGTTLTMAADGAGALGGTHGTAGMAAGA